MNGCDNSHPLVRPTTAEMNASTRRLVAVGLALALASVALGAASPAFGAGTWYVATTGNDSADCLTPTTPCASIGGALAKPGFVAGDAIRIATGTYTGLGAEVVRVDKSVSLLGGWDSSFASQVGTSTIDGAGTRRGVSVVGAVTVLVDRLTIQNGFERGGGGGGILNEGTLTVRNSVVTGNRSTYPEGSAQGGGILNAYGATLVVENTTITNNTGDFGGGGIFNVGAATITDSTIDGNTAGKVGFSGGGGGGGIEQFNGTSLNIVRSTISNNTLLGGFSGSGIEALGPVSLTTSTVSGNTGGTGEAIYSFVNAVTLTNTTVAGNQYGINNVGGSITLANSLVADNGTLDCFNNPSYSGGTVTSLGHNLVENNANCTLVASDLTSIDPRLGPLANNGGPTQTRALGAGSPALDNGDNALVSGGINTDQRGTGFARIVDASDADTTDEVDIGALEQHPSVEDVADQTINEDGSLVLSFNVGDADLAFDSVTVVSSNTTLVPNNASNISLSGSGSSRMLSVNPVANRFGATTITLTVSDTVAGTAQTMTDTFVLMVTPVADTPSVTNASTTPNTQTRSGLVISRNAADGAEVTHFKITNITNGTLFHNDGTTRINNNDFITFAQGNAGLKFTPATGFTGTAHFTVQASTQASDSGLGGSPVTADIIVGSPTAATVASFAARRDRSGRVVASWRTTAEATLLGFNLWRRMAGSASFERVNRKLIPARLSVKAGHNYAYLDGSAKPRRAYVYKLQIVNLDTTAAWTSVVTVRP